MTVQIGSWRRRRRVERTIAIAAGLLILAQIHDTSGLAGLGAALLAVGLAGLALDGLRRAGR